MEVKMHFHSSLLHQLDLQGRALTASREESSLTVRLYSAQLWSKALPDRVRIHIHVSLLMWTQTPPHLPSTQQQQTQPGHADPEHHSDLSS